MTGFEVETTAYGRPATELLAARIASVKSGDPLAPVTVVVPSNYAAVSTRRALAARPGGVANVDFVTLYRLAERLGGRALAAAGRRPVNAPVLGQAVRAILTRDPGVFSPVAGHPATELALVSAVRELAAVAEPQLDSLAEAGPRAADVVRIARSVRAGLSGEWFDEHDLVRSATEAADALDSPVIVHLLQSLSPAQADLLRALATRRSVLVNVGISGDPDADAPVLAAHAGADICVSPPAVPRPVASKVVSVSDPDEEVRAAVRAATGWMRSGVRLGRIAVLYGTANPYSRILHEQLEACGLPHNGAPVRQLGDMMVGRTLRSILALPDRDYRRSDVLALLTGAPIRDGDRLVPGRAWERISRSAGVVGGGDWAGRLPLFAEEQRLLAAEAERTEQDVRAHRLGRDAEWAGQLAGFVARLRRDVAAVAAAGSWAEMVASVAGILDEYLGGDRHRWAWSDEERRAADRVEEALERLSTLDAIGGPAPNVAVFRRALDDELEATLGRFGHLGEGILTGPVSMAVGVELDRVVVLGMAEGSFPARRLEDSLLPDDDRRRAGGQLALRTEKVHDDHRHLLAAVAAASEAVLVFPRGDLRRHGDRAASRWLLEDATRLSGQATVFTEDLARLSGPWLEKVPSFAAGIASSVFPASAQEMRLATMAIDARRIMSADPVLRRAMELAGARRGEGFTRFDGNLAGADLPDYTQAGLATSATRLQVWAGCPHAFLFQYLLGVEVAEDPERRLAMDPLEKGSMVHEILDRFIHEQAVAGRSGPWTGPQRDRLLEIAEEVCRAYEARGVTGRSVFWKRDRARIVADLQRFASEDTGRPLHTELRFDNARYPLPGGTSVGFRGAIDRVDRLGDGSVMVIDYKTGKADDYRRLGPEDPHDRGRRLQLAVYGTAAAQQLGAGRVEARYWFVTERGRFETVGYEVTAPVRDAVGGTLATIVEAIRAGIFPLRPPEKPSWGRVDCWYCSPDGLSSAEARRDWERKRRQAVLAGYVALAEPEALDAPA